MDTDDRAIRLAVAGWVHRITRDLKGLLDWRQLFAGTTTNPDRKFQEHNAIGEIERWSWETESNDIARGVVEWIWEIGSEGAEVQYIEPGRHVYLYRRYASITREQTSPPPEAVRAQRILSLVERITEWGKKHGEPSELRIGITSNPEHAVRELLREKPAPAYQVWDAGSPEIVQTIVHHLREQGYATDSLANSGLERYLVCAEVPCVGLNSLKER